MKALLPDTYRIDHEGKEITELEPLIQKLDQLYDDCNIIKPQELIDSVRTYRKALLNPSSHDDLKSPLYRREIQEAIHTYDKLFQLPKLDRTKVLDVGQVLLISFPGDQYHMEIELADNLFVTDFDGSKILSSVKYFIKRWEWQTEEYGVSEDGLIVRMGQNRIDRTITQKRTLEEIFEGINRSTTIAIPADIFAHVQIDARSLADLRV